MADGAEQSRKTGGMIALIPTSPDRLVVDSPNTETAEHMHLTLQFLGEDITGWSDEQRQAVVDAATTAAEALPGPIGARVMGHATFNPDAGPDGDREPCAVYLVGDSDQLGPLQQAITTACAAVLGDDHHPQHAPTIFHMTGGYGLTAADLTYTGPVTFDRIQVAICGHITDIPIAAVTAERARLAYIDGWARSGGPITPRVLAGCEAAMALAVEHADDPGILEATLDLGAGEGTWALVHARRDTVYAEQVSAIVTAWRALSSRLDIAAAIAAYRKALHLEEAATPEQKATAAAVAAALLAGAPDPTKPEWHRFVDAIDQGLSHADAEGVAGAVAVAASDAGEPGADVDAAYTDALAAQTPADNAERRTRAAGIAVAIVAAATSDTARALASAADEDEDDALMRATVARELLGDDDLDPRAASVLADEAIGDGITRGMLRWYRSAGAREVDFVTAASACQLCLDIEAQNPWTIGTVPEPPQHPYCRCTVITSERIPRAAFAAYLP